MKFSSSTVLLMTLLATSTNVVVGEECSVSFEKLDGRTINGYDANGNGHSISLGTGKWLQHADMLYVIGTFSSHPTATSSEYSNGDALWCPGGIRRSGKVIYIPDPDVSDISLIGLTEPGPCYYEVTLKIPCAEKDPGSGGDPPQAATGGDPHITTWKKEHFEYHGQCDLTMVKDPKFADGLGLDVQVRTKVVRFWAYNKNVAIKIGNDILEIEGSADANDAEAHYWINFDYQGELDTFAGFPVTQKAPSVYKRQYKIDLSPKYPGASIVVQLYKEFVRVQFNGGEEVFGNTVGLLGDYKTGKTLARDGTTVMDDFTEFGDEWQVLPSEPKIFHEIAHPQFPELCIKPEDPRGERQRRLAESTISIEQAEAACASLKDPLSIKDCVYDIMATQDLDMVGAF